jgi:hypothetical protein
MVIWQHIGTSRFRERKTAEGQHLNNFLLKKSYVRTRLSAIPECGWQWDVLNPFEASHPWGQVKVALELHRSGKGRKEMLTLCVVRRLFLYGFGG